MGTIRAVILHLSVFFIFKICAHRPPDRSTRGEEFVSLCLCKTKADPALAEEYIENGFISTEPCISCFYACLLQKLMLAYPNDTYNLDAFRERYGISLPMGELIRCNTTYGGNPDPCQRASGFLKCIKDVLDKDPVAERPS